ncbi:MAG TPA: TIR domain-containing protein [Rhizomicrobium sp.]|nr:TIR domain-containing protein [Rhizomicrobium sp.]
MSLPIRTTVTDIQALSAYLATKPTGATAPEARAVLDSKILDGRKLAAMKFWGVIEDNGGKMKLTEAGRRLAKDKGAHMADVIREQISMVPAYAAVVERALHKAELTVTATEVAAHWHEHFANDASDSDKILNDQAVCFFQLAEAAGLGELVLGRKGQPTRFDFNRTAVEEFVGSVATPFVAANDTTPEDNPQAGHTSSAAPAQLSTPDSRPESGNRVFITHGKNKKILEQVKELVAFGKFEPVVAQERETAAKPVPDKVMDEMRGCHAAVIHVGVEGVLLEKDGTEVPQINGNVLIEIGAAMALYGKNFILLVEEGAKLPSNLQGLYECRYKGDELNMDATMKLLKAFNAFR